MDAPDVKSALIEEVKGLSALIDQAVDYNNAITNAENETGWSLPVSGGFYEHWIKERAKRWLIFFLWTEHAMKFKVKQLSLDQKFKHLGQLIKKMDEDYLLAVEENPDKFGGATAYKMFGDVVAPGFLYDGVGNDVTYE